MKQAPKKLATLCALIGAGISCTGVAQAESKLKEAGPVTDAANRSGSDISSGMSLPSYDYDQIEKLWLAWREREAAPPARPRHNGLRVADAMLLKQKNAARKSVRRMKGPSSSLAGLPATVMNDALAVIDDVKQKPDYSSGNHWSASPDDAGLPVPASASLDNAADAIYATLNKLSEMRPDLFAPDMHGAAKPLLALDGGTAPRAASNKPVPVMQPEASSGNLTHLVPAVDSVQVKNIAEQANEIRKNSDQHSPTNEWLAVSNSNLEEMRGGFDNGAGLMVSFGIERAVYINGNLTTSVSFNIPDVSKLAAEQARITANQAKLALDQAKIAADQARVQADQARLAADQAKNIAEQARATAAQAVVAAVQTNAPAIQVAAPAVQASAPASQTGFVATQAGLNEQVRIASEQAKINSEQARLSSEQAKINSEQARLSSEQAKLNSIAGASVNLVQNGPGNTFQPGPLPQAAAATVIQNTLDNQSIKNLTIINTTVNSLSVLKALNAQISLRDALGSSLGVR